MLLAVFNEIQFELSQKLAVLRNEFFGNLFNALIMQAANLIVIFGEFSCLSAFFDHFLSK
jgi:hypothetical protein